MASVTYPHSSYPHRAKEQQAGADIAITAENLAPDLTSVIAEVSVESVCRYFGGIGYIPKPEAASRIRHTMDEADGLVTPEGIYTLCPLSGPHSGQELLLANGRKLSVPTCSVDTGVRLVATAICTLGDMLERECRQLAHDGKLFQSTLLDAIGTATLDLCAAKICRDIERHCRQFKLLMGHRFAPGLDGYPLEHQQLLFELADGTSVNVSLNRSAIMTPAKSISFFQMLTKNRLKEDRTNKCNSCKMAGCQFRIRHECLAPEFL